tara:strand:+ start:6789 stop:7019 length:231 start_codon:yes stop_codon:yes gene_type:complete
MQTFLRLEKSSNILGSKDKIVTYISVAKIVSVESDHNGGSIVTYDGSKEVNVASQTPDSLMRSCVVTLADTSIHTD